jgi:hypothetical protein
VINVELKSFVSSGKDKTVLIEAVQALPHAHEGHYHRNSGANAMYKIKAAAQALC